jgi:hypothetical protein
MIKLIGEKTSFKKLTKNLSDISIHHKVKISEGKSTATSVIGRKMVWVKNADKWANNRTGQRHEAYRMGNTCTGE